MLRRAVIGALASLALATPAGAQPKLLMPAVTYERQVQLTLHGPVVLHVLTVPRPGGLYALKPVLSNETILGREQVTAIEQRLAPVATTAGVNGDLFAAKDGRPSGILMRSGALDHTPSGGRSSIGIDASGQLRVDRVRLRSTWQGSGPRRMFTALNHPPGAAGYALYTPSWGPATPAATGSVEAVLGPFPPATPNQEIAGPVVELRSGGSTPIPPDGAVLVAMGSAGATLQAEAAVGQQVRIRLILQPDWVGVVDALGGGPLLVRDGQAVFQAGEEFSFDQLTLRQPRTAVGQLSDGRIVLVAVDGRAPGYSTGMTNFELALALVRLGAVTGAALDGGGSTTMAFEGTLLNRPSDPGGERAVAEALLVEYAGVQAGLPGEPVLSPNGDGIAEKELLGYKVVRPANVAASLLGPDGQPRYSFTGAVQPGTYPFEWPGKREDGSVEVEGRWRWVVSAVDDLSRESAVERPFDLNLTLGFPKTAGPALAVPRVRDRIVASFVLSHPATLGVRIETLSGALVRTIARPSRVVPAGGVSVTWDGRTDSGAVVYSGRYVARVTARNSLGTVSLTAQLSVRRKSGSSGR